MNIQILRAADLNGNWEKECPKGVSVQKICKVCGDELEVRKVLEEM